MKKYLAPLLLLVLLLSCRSKKLSPAEMVTKYYEAFNSSEFEEITPLIADSIIIAEGEYVTSYSHDSFHEQFKWDSIFQPTYKIVELINQNNQVIATVASASKRYDFLKNNPLTCKYKISFRSSKIAKIEVLECLDANWAVWRTQRDSLVSWAKNNHSELDGFINDLTINGAINYLKAIELYENRSAE